MASPVFPLTALIISYDQDPTLLSGTLRYNLDPWDTCDDSELNDALRSSGLTMTGHSKDGASTPQSLTLESNISAGGSNLSQGEFAVATSPGDNALNVSYI